MSLFKVGDKVRVTSLDLGDSRYFNLGAEGTVVGYAGACVEVRFTSGDYNTKNNGCWFVLPRQIELVVPYSATFTEKATAEPTTGHVNDSPIQKHSVGDLYPIAVVGYARDSETTVWVVENLEKGTVACAGEGYVRQWDYAEDAFKFAASAKSGVDSIGAVVTWFPGRPRFPLSTVLSLK